MQSNGVGIARAAAQLGVSADTVRRRLKSGALEGEKVGGVWWVSLPGERYLPESADNSLVLALESRIAAQDRTIEDQARQIGELHQLLARTTTPAVPAPGSLSLWRRMFKR